MEWIRKSANAGACVEGSAVVSDAIVSGFVWGASVIEVEGVSWSLLGWRCSVVGDVLGERLPVVQVLVQDCPTWAGLEAFALAMVCLSGGEGVELGTARVW